MRIAVSDVPEKYTILQYIRETTDFLAQCNKVANGHPHYHDSFIRLKVKPSMLSGLRSGVLSAIDKYGLHPWLSSAGRPEESEYDSFSITYNKNHKDSAVVDPHTSTLGTTEVLPNSYFYGGSNMADLKLKNGYYDTYGFNARTPATYESGFKEFVDSFNSTLTRSRVSAVRPEYEVTSSFSFGWHKDESIFENTRIVIPIDTDEAYRLQMEPSGSDPDPYSKTMIDCSVPFGEAVVFDTHKPHRAYRVGQSTKTRINAIFGVAPWFDYIPEEQAWVSNRFYGEVHPFDLVRNGWVTPYIEAYEHTTNPIL